MASIRICGCIPFFRRQPPPPLQEQVVPVSDTRQAPQQSQPAQEDDLTSQQIQQIQKIIEENERIERLRLLKIRQEIAQFKEMEPFEVFMELQSKQNQFLVEARVRNKVRIATMYSKQSVQFVSEFPSDLEGQMAFRYCCPICLRYFNNVLQSSCCKNYLCRLCCEQMIRKSMNDKAYVFRCAHCLTDDFKIDDVRLEDKIKYYTDTPYKFLTTAGKPHDETPGGVEDHSDNELIVRKELDLTQADEVEGDDELRMLKLTAIAIIDVEQEIPQEEKSEGKESQPQQPSQTDQASTHHQSFIALDSGFASQILNTEKIKSLKQNQKYYPFDFKSRKVELILQQPSQKLTHRQLQLQYDHPVLLKQQTIAKEFRVRHSGVKQQTRKPDSKKENNFYQEQQRSSVLSSNSQQNKMVSISPIAQKRKRVMILNDHSPAPLTEIKPMNNIRISYKVYICMHQF